MDSAAAACARAYYRALDDHEYDALADRLAPGFVHVRPDRTLDGRERFLRFMREERPNQHTRHRVDALYHPADDAETSANDGAGAHVLVQGRLLDLERDGDVLFEFVDAFDVDADAERIERIDTYARSV